jgi:hypothetical protein
MSFEEPASPTMTMTKKTSDGQDSSQSDFPSLAMAAMVPYGGSNDKTSKKMDNLPSVKTNHNL